MKMRIIGAVVLMLVLGLLYVLTGGLQSSDSTEPEMNGEPEAVLVEPVPADAQPAGNKNFNL
jgi:hypothetical protein